MAGHSTRHHVTLPPSTPLTEALAVAVESVGASSGQVELLAGSLSRVSYCFPALCLDGSTAVTYSQTHEAAAPARLIAGAATVGFRDGRRFVHCHAAWFDANGEIHGGHLWPETTTGAEPVHVVVHASDSVEMISATDPETRMPVFTPHQRAPRGSARPAVPVHRSRVVVSRLAPGIVLESAICEIMQEHGFTQASINGSLGSLVGAVLHRSGGVLIVDGPATEVILTGTVELGRAGTYRLAGMAIDRFGTVHAGEFAGAENVVAVTLELLVQEIPE